jgi:hypothetical protein
MYVSKNAWIWNSSGKSFTAREIYKSPVDGLTGFAEGLGYQKQERAKIEDLQENAFRRSM